MDKDFEIKRLVIGLSTLTLSPGSANLDQSLQNRFPGFMKALVYLCRKSLELRQKQQEKIEKAEVANDQEAGIIFDEEDQGGEDIELPDDIEESDWDLSDDDEVDETLYDTKLDKIDEVLMVQESMSTLQAQNAEFFQ